MTNDIAKLKRIYALLDEALEQVNKVMGEDKATLYTPNAYSVCTLLTSDMGYIERRINSIKYAEAMRKGHGDD